MGKTTFDFYNGMSKINNRYKEYKEQETIFSKTIDMKPLLPFKESQNTFIESEVPKIKKQENLNLKPTILEQKKP